MKQNKKATGICEIVNRHWRKLGAIERIPKETTAILVYKTQRPHGNLDHLFIDMDARHEPTVFNVHFNIESCIKSVCTDTPQPEHAQLTEEEFTYYVDRDFIPISDTGMYKKLEKEIKKVLKRKPKHIYEDNSLAELLGG